MKKRLFALVLAGAMTLGASMTAFAADTTVDNDSTTEAEVTGTGKIETPTIKVTVPSAFDVVLNPFQIAYTINNVKYNSQVVTAPMAIKNESNVPVAVNITEFKATPSTGVTVLNKTVGKATDKSVYLYLEMVDNKKVADASKAKFTGSATLVPGDTAKKDAVMVLGAAEYAVPEGGGDPAVKAGTETYAAFKIAGDVVANPVKDGAADAWASSDKVDVSIKFTFTPQVMQGK